MFVTVDGEDLPRKVFRWAQNGIKCEGRERKIRKIIKTSNINEFKRNFPHGNYELIFSKFQIIHF